MRPLLYNALLILLGILALPKLLQRKIFLQKLGFVQYPSFAQGTIWMHAVSVGEVRAMAALFQKMQKAKKTIVISTTTQTGLQEAKRSLPGASYYFLLPLDFSWNMKRLTQALNPSLLLLCESDFWYHLLYYAKEAGARICLINGKISERSFRRFSLARALSRKLFDLFDCLCVQSEEYAQRFFRLVSDSTRIHVTGNLKLEAPQKLLSEEDKYSLREKLQIDSEQNVVVIASTHQGEEEQLLNALNHLPDLKILLVPRHPQRFDAVAQLLEKKGLSFTRYSSHEKIDCPIVLIDTMGKLIDCYQIADLAIVAGSYVPHIGGHNIFEPIQYGIPVFFGPYMQSQKDLESLVLSFQAGKQVGSAELATEIALFFSSTELQRSYARAGRDLMQNITGSVDKTLAAIFSDSKLVL